MRFLTQMHLPRTWPWHPPLMPHPSPLCLPGPTLTPPPSPVYSWSRHPGNHSSPRPHMLRFEVLSAAGPTANCLHPWYSCSPQEIWLLQCNVKTFSGERKRGLCVLVRGWLTAYRFSLSPLFWKQRKNGRLRALFIQIDLLNAGLVGISLDQ